MKVAREGNQLQIVKRIGRLLSTTPSVPLTRLRLCLPTLPRSARDLHLELLDLPREGRAPPKLLWFTPGLPLPPWEEEGNPCARESWLVNLVSQVEKLDPIKLKVKKKKWSTKRKLLLILSIQALSKTSLIKDNLRSPSSVWTLLTITRLLLPSRADQEVDLLLLLEQETRVVEEAVD